MKKVMVLLAVMALYATAASAVGCDFNFNACPGGVGSATDATIDCAGGDAVLGYITFQPAEAIPDLVGFDSIIDITVAGDVSGAANFWDFSSVNAGALSVSLPRPAAICNAYASVWGVAGSTESHSALVFSSIPNHVRIAVGANRPTDFACTLNQKIFGCSLTIDASTSVEAGGSTNGCELPAWLALTQLIPQSRTNGPASPLVDPSANVNTCSHINGDVTQCRELFDPTLRHTWGRLKSLYR